MITTIIAIYGAALSSLAIGWNLYRDFTEKGRLRVSCYRARLCNLGEGIEPEHYLVWHITNVGRQPVFLTNIGGVNKDNTEFLLSFPRTKLPKQLLPGEYVIEYVDDFSIISDNLLELTARDSYDRKFKAPRKQIKKLKIECAS